MNHRHSAKTSLQPFYVGAILASLAEALIFQVWGLGLFPFGTLGVKLGLLVSSGVIMGAAIGTVVVFIVLGRLQGWWAFIYAMIIFQATVGLFCVGLSWTLVEELHILGRNEPTTTPLMGSLVITLALGVVYAYLIFTQAGRHLLSRLGL